MLAFVATFARDASAAGSFKLRSTEVTEVSGAWHIFVTIELTKAPLVAHQSMKFVFTRTAVYERALVDGHEGPVITRVALANQTPTVEGMDVDFADATGKIFKGTHFDFGLTRTRGYEAGEYKVEVRTADSIPIGGTQYLTLKGDNEIIDRRAVTFNAKDKSMKKVSAYDAGAPPADGNPPPPPPAAGAGPVTPTGTAQPFVPKEGFEKTQEEEIKTRPSGCGCSVPGTDERSPIRSLAWLTPIAAIGLVAYRRRRN